MAFSPEQLAALKAPLRSDAVRQRNQAGRAVSYIEGWHAIAEANRIFGFDGWTRETLDVRCVAERERQVGQGQGWGVSYIAKVRILAGPTLVREGIGAGHGIDRDLGQAHESAIKEAETDAMKRALMTFGNPFGLALYDKEQRNVAEPAPEPDESALRYIAECERKIAEKPASELIEWWRSESGARRAFDLSQSQVDALKARLTARLQEREAA